MISIRILLVVFGFSYFGQNLHASSMGYCEVEFEKVSVSELPLLNGETVIRGGLGAHGLLTVKYTKTLAGDKWDCQDAINTTQLYLSPRDFVYYRDTKKTHFRVKYASSSVVMDPPMSSSVYHAYEDNLVDKPIKKERIEIYDTKSVSGKFRIKFMFTGGCVAHEFKLSLKCYKNSTISRCQIGLIDSSNDICTELLYNDFGNNTWFTKTDVQYFDIRSFVETEFNKDPTLKLKFPNPEFYMETRSGEKILEVFNN